MVKLMAIDAWVLQKSGHSKGSSLVSMKIFELWMNGLGCP